MPVMCSWDEGQVCENAAWVVAYQCDRCGYEGMLDICKDHYEGTFIDYQGNTQTMNCPKCPGVVSWVARSMSGFYEDARINGKA